MFFFWLDLVVDLECNCFVLVLKNVVFKLVCLYCFQFVQLDFLFCFIDLCNCGGEIFYYVDMVFCDMILNFIVVGCDIMVGILIWFFYMMSLYFEIVDKIFDEFFIVVVVVGKYSEGILWVLGICFVVNLFDVFLCGNCDF